MLKQTVKYTDYNDEAQVQDLYFNLTKTELMDFLDILPRLEAFSDATTGEPRDLTTDEIKEMLSLIKVFIEKSYGVRSEDGKFFRKSPELFEEFQQSAAYDTFVFGLFEDLDNANNFLTGIVPKDLAKDARDQLSARSVETVQTGAELSATEMEVPAYIREDREPTQKELAEMSPEELQMAFKRRMDK